MSPREEDLEARLARLARETEALGPRAGFNAKVGVTKREEQSIQDAIDIENCHCFQGLPANVNILIHESGEQ